MGDIDGVYQVFEGCGIFIDENQKILIAYTERHRIVEVQKRNGSYYDRIVR